MTANEIEIEHKAFREYIRGWSSSEFKNLSYKKTKTGNIYYDDPVKAYEWMAWQARADIEYERIEKNDSE